MGKKLKPSDLAHPDKLLLVGIKSLNELTNVNLYARQKSKAKGKSQVTFIGEQKLDRVKQQLFTFNEADFAEQNEADFSFFDHPSDKHRYWLNIHGLHDVTLIQMAGVN